LGGLWHKKAQQVYAGQGDQIAQIFRPIGDLCITMGTLLKITEIFCATF
jgi:hypothetical protein